MIIISPATILLGYAGIGILNYFGHQDGKPMNRWFINILAPFEGNHDTITFAVNFNKHGDLTKRNKAGQVYYDMFKL